MPPAVDDLVHSVLRQPVKVVVGEKNAAADTVEQSLVVCGREDGKLVALRQMVREGLRPPVLIFMQSVERAMQLFHALVYGGLHVDVLHAERTAAQRTAAQLEATAASSAPARCCPVADWMLTGCSSSS
jgi:ATP-dependent RNA helicase DDX52/ROK1